MENMFRSLDGLSLTLRIEELMPILGSTPTGARYTEGYDLGADRQIQRSIIFTVF